MTDLYKNGAILLIDLYFADVSNLSTGRVSKLFYNVRKLNINISMYNEVINQVYPA